MAEPDRRRTVPSELGVAALVIASAIPLGRLFRSGNVAGVSFFAAATSAAVAWGLRRLRAPAILAALASLAAFLWFASIAFFRESMLGPFPTPDSIGQIWDAVVDAVRRSQTDVAPVAATDAFLCLTSFAVWATAWLADDAAIKLRHPMLAIGVTVPLYVLPGTIIEAPRRWADAGIYLGAALWVLFQDERFRLSRWGRVIGAGTPGWRPGLAARMGVVAIALALVAAPVLPGFGAPPGLRGVAGQGNRAAINPLVSIQPRLQSRLPIRLFTVRSRGFAYWRLTALDRFDGRSWRTDPQSRDRPISGRSVAPQNPSSTARMVQEIEISGLAGPWLPAAYEPTQVDDLRGVTLHAASRTLIADSDLRNGTKYTVTSRLPQLHYDQLALAPHPAESPSVLPYLELPGGVYQQQIDDVRAIAQSWVEEAGATDQEPFLQAVALQKRLRTYTYDEDVALKHSISNIRDFLVDIKRGYCEQFATAMAVMARTLGLPARVAVGFAGGEPTTTPDEVVVTTRNAHAWVEILLPPYGWVEFEPTPRSDSVVVPPYTSPATALPDQSPTATPSASEEPTPTDSPTTGRQAPEPENLGSRNRSLAGRFVPVGLAAGALLLLLIVAFPIAARVRHVLRRRRARTAQELIAVRYLDFLDWCAAAGAGRRAAETPLEHARRLAGTSSDGDVLELLAVETVAAVYAPPNGADPDAVAKLARSARATVGGRLSKRKRTLAALGWGWWRTDPAGRGRVMSRMMSGRPF